VLQAYDAVTALLKAIDAVATEEDDGSLRIDRQRLADTLREQRFAGLTGSVTFDERGERRGETPAELGITVYRVFNAQLVAVE
jgi:ABC-type branched-subunit amino acid transport system substrate-binding protein